MSSVESVEKQEVVAGVESEPVSESKSLYTNQTDKLFKQLSKVSSKYMGRVIDIHKSLDLKAYIEYENVIHLMYISSGVLSKKDIVQHSKDYLNSLYEKCEEISNTCIPFSELIKSDEIDRDLIEEGDIAFDYMLKLYYGDIYDASGDEALKQAIDEINGMYALIKPNVFSLNVQKYVKSLKH